ncbi:MULTISPECIES: flagellar hook protein FlgE [unclassified Rhizobacter]|uniref:flagellar hook protein FlgE n=1 Tax=unclassified Rhizobacter TaxID=2640088 RepID=UPI0006F4ABB2|nr:MULTISPECIES: flagellar hook protein FlgE [unclassified Rhizobacter]KQU71326.1 flagellar biosynthesis protein FlgE [Rhizobacter sp. Root29]KQW10628.1 flagellar biosynthesis protein FlgE [Rhizobacter sp. Root1238]KRB24704.1 flagellar biosynthesis protein FlgE [Rhizobacter sp. Root16D2]
MGFQQGLSGLNASSKNLEVIGNNVANANTFGAKASRAEFADMYAAAMNGSGANKIGIGVNLAAVTQQFSQGSITTTESSLDVAINGSGFFQLNDNGTTVYSRNGQFQVNKDGYIVSNGGLKLMGYKADGTGTIQPGQAVPLQLPTAGIDPAATKNITLEMNLDSRAATTLPATTPQINLTDAKTYNNATSLTVYDAKGQDVALTYYFQKAGTDQWNVYVTANGTSLAVDGAGDPAPVTTLQFPTNGGNPTAPVGAVTLDIPATTNAAGAETLAISGVQLNLGSATQYGAGFGVTDLKQDGYAPGQLSGLSIEDNGIVMATYSNGQSKPAGQMELANFRNAQGLKPLGGNNWSRSYESGDPILGVPSEGNMGVLQSGALEESNVDLTAELVNMMTAQRTYQANAQTIKTQDQVLQTLVNLR